MHPSRRSTLAFLGGLACVSPLPRSFAQTNPSSPTVRVAIISRTVFYAPLWAAQARHLFRDQSLPVAITVFDNAELITQALKNGDIDIAISTPESVMLDATSGGPLRMVAGNAEKLPHQIIARPPIRTTKDLIGARFGVLSLKEGTAYLVKRYAESMGLKPDQYTVLAVGGAPTRWKRLQEAAIDVGFQPFPLSYVAEAAGYQNLGAISSLFPYWLFTSVNVHQEWAQKNRDLLKQFLAVLNSAQHQISAKPQDFSDLMAQELQTSAVFAELALNQALSMQMFAPELRVYEPAVKAVFDALIDTEQIPPNSPFKMKTFFDPSYL